MSEVIMALFFVGGLFVWLFPTAIVTKSRRISANEKIAWILLMLFLSWFAFIFFCLMAPIGRTQKHQRPY